MKKIFTSFVSLILLLLFLNGCDNPGPTELVDNTNEEIEYELINDPVSENYLASGVDTSGITQDFRNLSNLISVSGIKITANNNTENFSLAQAFFFDKSHPIYNSLHQIIAYETMTPGSVYFDDIKARLVQHRIKYFDEGQIKETSIGFKYLLFSGRNGNIDPYFFRYNSSTNFKLSFLNDSVMFPIQTPPEITGSVIVNGSRGSGDLRLALNWNAENYRRITIVIGFIKNGQLFSIPVYRIKTADDGELQIPERLLNGLPLDEFSGMVVTFVRIKEKIAGSESSSLLLSAQSIHSIIFGIP